MGTLSSELKKFVAENEVEVVESGELSEEYVNLQKEMEKVSKATKLNQHTLAVKVAAKAIGAKKIEKIADSVMAIEKLEGYMPRDLGKYRDSDLMGQLRQIAKQELSGEALVMFNDSF